jgi:tRNA(fMet)-specific endonuclease VapC
VASSRRRSQKYLLDTDTCIHALKRNESILRHLLDVAISVITETELRTGAAKCSSPVKTFHLIENFLRPLTIIDFTSDDAIAYATVRARLEGSGTPIGPLDTLIASQAVSRKLVLVTNNEREFRRVTALRRENWTS